MRMFPQQIDGIKQHARNIFGPLAVVQIFGSRLDYVARGGEVDLHVDCAVSLELPALAIISLDATYSSAMSGRKVGDSQIGPSIM